MKRKSIVVITMVLISLMFVFASEPGTKLTPTFGTCPQPGQAGTKKNWLVREIPNSFSVAVITTAKDEPKLHAALRSSTAM
jgi:hypothetical protein